MNPCPWCGSTDLTQDVVISPTMIANIVCNTCKRCIVVPRGYAEATWNYLHRYVEREKRRQK